MRFEPTPIPTFPLKGKESAFFPFEGKELRSLPFKGRARVGMGLN
jgi:hypothetical protein